MIDARGRRRDEAGRRLGLGLHIDSIVLASRNKRALRSSRSTALVHYSYKRRVLSCLHRRCRVLEFFAGCLSSALFLSDARVVRVHCSSHTEVVEYEWTRSFFLTRISARYKVCAAPCRLRSPRCLRLRLPHSQLQLQLRMRVRVRTLCSAR